MSRDYRKFRVFVLADRLVLETYSVTVALPNSEREWLKFLNIAAGYAAEACYLANVAGRLGFVASSDAAKLEQGYSELVAGLRAMSRALREKGASP